MRSFAVLSAVAAIGVALAHGADAQERIRLAQSSTVTNCMMSCNAQAANCRTTCVVPAPAVALPSPSSSPASNLNASASGACISACSSTQLTCQSGCALQSPSQ
jgi:hypothetical protein